MLEVVPMSLSVFCPHPGSGLAVFPNGESVEGNKLRAAMRCEDSVRQTKVIYCKHVVDVVFLIVSL